MKLAMRDCLVLIIEVCGDDSSIRDNVCCWRGEYFEKGAGRANEREKFRTMAGGGVGAVSVTATDTLSSLVVDVKLAVDSFRSFRWKILEWPGLVGIPYIEGASLVVEN